MFGGIGGMRKMGQKRFRCLEGITDSMDVSLSELRELVMDGEALRAAIHGVTKSRTWLSDWTELNRSLIFQEQTNRKRDHICGYQKKGVLNEGGKKVQTPIYKIDTRAAKYNILNMLYCCMLYMKTVKRVNPNPHHK